MLVLINHSGKIQWYMSTAKASKPAPRPEHGYGVPYSQLPLEEKARLSESETDDIARRTGKTEDER